MRLRNSVRLAMAGAALGLMCVAAGARAQDEIAPELQCLRYLQGAERSMHIPQGLLTAISLVETGRVIANSTQVTPWPWSININGQGKFFETKEDAVKEVRALLDQGQRSIDVGCMQVNLRYHPEAFRTLEDAFDPATNVAYGAQFLNSLHQLQGSWANAIERYHSSDEGRRDEYRLKVLAFWNDQARNIVMDSALSENTDTPYHHAMRDFAEGKYADALVKYQAILRENPKDRLGLLGIAMSYEKLGNGHDADVAYGKYLAVDPDNGSALARQIAKARALPAENGRASLESLVEAGVSKSELFAALADMSAAMGDNGAGFQYATQAVERTPYAANYNLNAAILADRLKKSALAVKYYEDYLALIERSPVTATTSISGVRDRVRFLRARL
jgi:tetratricopeptide (TPR) repeat protein